MNPYAQHPQPPPKKAANGWLIALGIVGGVLLLGGIVVGVAIYAFVTSDVGQTTIKVIGATSRLAQKGMNAPGTAQIRAAGCEQAMVLDMKDFGELMADLTDAGPDASMPEGLMVTCQVRAMTPAPSCNTVAAAYMSAVGTASSEFVVTVSMQGGSNHPLCQATYDSSGTFIK